MLKLSQILEPIMALIIIKKLGFVLFADSLAGPS